MSACSGNRSPWWSVLEAIGFCLFVGSQIVFNFGVLSGEADLRARLSRLEAVAPVRS